MELPDPDPIQPQALLIAAEDDDAVPRLLFRVAGTSVFERSVIQARASGIDHVVLCARTMPAALLAAIDRLRARGVTVELARTAGEAAGRVHPDECVLIADGALVVPNDIHDLIVRSGESIHAVGNFDAYRSFERINSESVWTGLAVVKGIVVRNAADIPGDWALAPTLLRGALQAGVAVTRHDTPSDEGFWVSRPETADDAARAAHRLVARTRLGDEEPVWLRHAATVGGKLAIGANLAAPLVEALSALVLVAALIASGVRSPAVAFFLVAVAMLPALAARRVAAASLAPLRIGPYHRVIAALAVATMCCWVVLYAYHGGAFILVIATLWFLTSLALEGLGLDYWRKTPRWFAEPTLLALLLGLGHAAGVPLAGLAAAIAILTWTQVGRTLRLGRP